MENNHDRDKFSLANKIIELENQKIADNREISKIALENQNKSDERKFKIAQEKNKLNVKIFYGSIFLFVLILVFIFYLTLKENKFGISILTHFFFALFSGVASYFYGKNKRE